jgi:glycosyltransferase involved in cell wall biosynthesis
VSTWLIASGDFTTLGGMDRANHAQARYLAGRGDGVHLVAHRVSDDLRRMPGVHVHDVSRPLGAHLAGAPLLAREAGRQARALGPSARVLVNGGNAGPGSATWVHYLHAAYVPVVQASIRTRLSAAAGRRYYLRREQSVLSRSPLVICNSHRTADDVRRHYGVPDARLRVAYYGVDAESFFPVTSAERAAARQALGIRDGRRVALFIGALGDRRKGFDALFDAWRTLAGDPPWDVDLLAAGTGAERTAWAERARREGLGATVRLLGFRTDVASVIAAADVLVHPARYEAYGLGVHEALCRGIPAIVSASAGVAERYPADLKDLLVPDPIDAAQLAARLRSWRAEADAWPARMAAFAAGLRSRTWDDMAAEIAAWMEAA